MNYTESQKLLKVLKSASNILINCHSRPDADSVGSAGALSVLLQSWGKTIKIICPDEVPDKLAFLEKYRKGMPVEKIQYRNFDFSQWDAFICLDSSSWARVAGDSEAGKPDIPILVIDHHKTNTGYGDINLIDPEMAACSQLLYRIFDNWGEKVTESAAITTNLLTGIIGDTGAFRFPEADRDTFRIAMELMANADKDEIIKNLYQNYSLNSVKLWGKMMAGLEVDTKHRYAWSAITEEVFAGHGRPEGSKSEIADTFFQSIEGTDFGMVIVEESPNFVSVSLRSRTGFDVSAIAEKLEGGGHRWAAAGRVEGHELKDALDIIHSIVQKEVNQNRVE